MNRNCFCIHHHMRVSLNLPSHHTNTSQRLFRQKQQHVYIYIYIVHPNHRLPFVHGRTPAHTRHTNDTLPGYNNWICGSREISTKASPRDYAAYFQVMFRQASCVPSSVPGLPNLESTYSCHLATLRHFFCCGCVMLGVPTQTPSTSDDST